MRLIAIVTALVFLVSGCAAMFSGTKDTITMRSHEKGTTFYVNEAEAGRDSAVWVLSKNNNSNAFIRASKEGCEDVTMPIPTEFDGLTLLGLLIDLGLISILIIDGAATGAWTKAAQTNFILTPKCPA